MTKWKTALLGLAAVAATSAASAEQLAARTERPIVPVSRVIGTVEARTDYGDFSAVHYNRDVRAYEIRYVTKDGSTKLIVIDAVTGKVKG